MPAKKADTAKADPDKADETPAKATQAVKVDPRIAGAYFLGGVWYASDGSPLTSPESQQAHRARDKELMEQRRRALLGG